MRALEAVLLELAEGFRPSHHAHHFGHGAADALEAGVEDKHGGAGQQHENQKSHGQIKIDVG